MRTFPSRNKHIPYLRVYCRRTEREYISETGTTTASILAEPFCDLYYDNTIYLCHFDEDISSLPMESGGIKYLTNEVYPSSTSRTADVMSIFIDSTDATAFASCFSTDITAYKFGGTSLRVLQNPQGFIDMTTNNTYVDIDNDLDFTTSRQFTLEFWFKPDNPQRRLGSVLCQYGSWQDYNSVPPSWSIWCYTNSATGTSVRSLAFRAWNSATMSSQTFTLNTSINLSLGTWHHFALVKNTARHMSVFIDGHKQLDFQNMPSAMRPKQKTDADLSVFGNRQVTTAYNFNMEGNIDELRYTTGYARYTSNSFTLATSAFVYTPCFDGNVVWLCTFDHTLQGSTAFFEATGKTITINTGPSVDFTPTKWLSTGYFDGLNDRMKTDSHVDFDLSVGDFTVEMYIHPYTGGGSGLLSRVVQIGDNSVTGSMCLVLEDANPTRIKAMGYKAGGYFDLMDYGSTLTNNSFSHIAFVRQGKVYKMYKGGVLDSEKTLTDTYVHTQGAFYVGNDNALSNPLLANLEDLRLTKNGARFTSDFVVTTRSLPYRPEL